MIRRRRGRGRAHGSPPVDAENFARWACGSFTRFCHRGMHGDCAGTVHTVLLSASCLCFCHRARSQP